jgi:AraC family transcriptional regulator, regulatory protein of adaptative response / methylated-DNA-[protein]-cysteine methyltransferase
MKASLRTGGAPSVQSRTAGSPHVHYATAECWLGQVLVASSDVGLCAVLLGDDRDELERELQARFGPGMVRDGGSEMRSLIGAVIQLIEEPDDSFARPLDLRGTGFQIAVWNALKQVRPGQTVSYSALARRIERPRSARAVAAACAANELAVIIPCHRVVRSDGALSGYRWGVERKRGLLELERAFYTGGTSKMECGTVRITVDATLPIRARPSMP